MSNVANEFDKFLADTEKENGEIPQFSNEKNDNVPVEEKTTDGAGEKDIQQEKEENGEAESAGDDDFFNPLTPSELTGNSGDEQEYASDSDEQNDKPAEELQDRDAEKESEKKNFDDIIKDTPYKAGRMNKTKILAVFFGVFFVSLILFNIVSTAKAKKKAAEKAQTDQNVNTDFTPQFGYRRKYQKEPEVTVQAKDEDIKKLDEALRKKDTPEPRRSSGYAYTAPAANPDRESIESPIRKKVNGFGEANTDRKLLPQIAQAAGYTENYSVPSGTGSGNGTMISQDQYTAQQLKNMQDAGLFGTAAGTGSDAQKSINNGRFSQNGQFNIDNKKGGQYSAIPPNTIYPGMVIHGELVTGINTDYPGEITGRVTENVFDSRTGKKLLIPQGSLLRGAYSSSSVGVSRVQISWNTLVINRDGQDFIVSLGGMNGIDMTGYAGINGFLDDHFFSYFKAMGLITASTILNSEIYYYTKAQKNETLKQIIADDQTEMNKLGDKLMNRALDIQTTVYVNRGTPIAIDINVPLTLPAYERDRPEQRYVR